MTDLRRALTEALVLAWYIRSDTPSPEELAERILATEPMQDIARLAAIGAAVERLQRYRSSFTLDWHPHAWLVTVRVTPDSKGVADTLPAAIEEALR